MKLFAIFFSFYLFILALIPCGDGEECFDFNPLTGMVQHDNHGEREQEEESCPPFCACSCCSQVLGILKQVMYKVEVIPDSNRPFPGLISRLTAQSPSGIWQPPRFS